MPPDRQALYGPSESRALREREEDWERVNREKFDVVLAHLPGCRRLLDIGCGWGQLLRMASGVVPELWGVDESADRLADTRAACPQARTVQGRAESLPLADGCFDVALTSQMLHEAKLFGAEGELERALREIQRVLTDGGRYLLLDHLDAGDGEATLTLPDEALTDLARFERRFTFAPARHDNLGDGLLRLSRRCVQDFLTKAWSFDGPMEEMEMRETHNVFRRPEITRLVEEAGFRVTGWTPFSDIRDDLRRVGGRLIEGEGWFRKFLLVAVKTP